MTYALTYRTPEEAQADKAEQLLLLSALDGARSRLGRDECGAWTIQGKDGHIYTWGAPGRGWVLYVCGRSARHWSAIKRRLHFCRVTQDGDDEGCFHLQHLPSTEEAGAIRRALRLPRRRPPPKAPFPKAPST